MENSFIEGHFIECQNCGYAMKLISIDDPHDEPAEYTYWCNNCGSLSKTANGLETSFLIPNKFIK